MAAKPKARRKPRAKDSLVRHVEVTRREPAASYRHHVHHSTEGHVCAVKDEKIARAIVAALNKEFAGTFRYEHR